MDSHLTDLLHPIPYTQSRSLRSSNKDLLATPRTRLRTFGDRAFSVNARTLWNTLPLHVCSAPSLPIFKKHLKTFIYIY